MMTFQDEKYSYNIVPPSLQCLNNLNQIRVKQHVELCEVFCDWDANNTYAIKNTQGENLFYAAEDTNCCVRNCCCLGGLRPFEMKISDNSGNEVIHLRRDLACDSCLFPCCLQKLQVFSPPGNLVGTVEQTWSMFSPHFNIKNERGQTVLKIKGPCYLFNCCAVDYHVFTPDNARVGKIAKQWSGMCRECCTNADFFKISFPDFLDVRMKTVLIGACFLIDFMYFHNSSGAACALLG